MRTELHKLHWTWKETVNRLDSLARDVREAKNVMEASNFARWLDFCGMIQIFRDNPSTQKHLEVDADVVQKKVRDLIYECGELFRGGKADPKYAASDIAEINRKLDTLTMLANQPARSIKKFRGGLDETLHNGERLRPSIETPGQKLIGVNGSANSERCRNGAAQGKQ